MGNKKRRTTGEQGKRRNMGTREQGKKGNRGTRGTRGTRGARKISSHSGLKI